MLDCLILDDSITNPPLVLGLDCVVAQIKLNPPPPTNILLLNITDEAHTFDSLFELRQRVVANAVVWVLPTFDLHLHDLVVEVADYYHDRVL
jgi:hypothetical protein